MTTNESDAAILADPILAEWLARDPAADAPGWALALPSAQELPPHLLDLAVPHEDIGPLVAHLPAPGTAGLLWPLLERCAAALVGSLGQVASSPPLPAFPATRGAAGRYFACYVVLAALPALRAFHAARGIPEPVTRRTLADIGRQMALRRQETGVGGLTLPWWPLVPLRGALYQLGRLQFQRETLSERAAAALGAAGCPCAVGEPVLAIHIPALYGPLTPAACDAAFAEARDFFPRHFPEERPRLATCHSWLLDPQLAAVLPPESNIVGFARRFHLAAVGDPDDAGIVRHIFGAGATPPFPRRTRLERAVADHLAAGGHWHRALGWQAIESKVESRKSKEP